MNYFIYFMILISTLFFMSCEKEKPAPNLNIDHGGYIVDENIELNFQPEIKDSTFRPLETVPIVGNITANFNLHGYSLRLKQNSTNNILFSRDIHTHGSSIDFSYNWTNTVQKLDTLTMTITIFGNHTGGSIEKTIYFYTQD